MESLREEGQKYFELILRAVIWAVLSVVTFLAGMAFAVQLLAWTR